MKDLEAVDVVVVGGGIMGLTSAYELARVGQRVLLVERAELGAGSTSKAAGGLRIQFSDESNILLGARSLESYVRMQEERHHALDLLRTGYLFLLSDPADLARFERDVALQNSLGLPTRFLTVAEAVDLSPVVSPDGLIAAVFNPLDAHCTPEAAVGAYAHEARRAGAALWTRAELVDIEVTAGRVSGVHVAADGLGGPREVRIGTDHVVCAAGVWSPAVGAMVGLDLPIRPLRRQVIVTEPVGFDARALPFTIDFSTSLYFHSEGSGLLLGAPEVVESHDFDLRRDPAWLEHLGELIDRRAPALADVEVRAGWAGLYEVTPDHNALIGTAPDVAGFHYACGFSGHGFLQGPAVGEVVRDLVCGNPTVIDVSGLGLDRFAGGALRRELTVV